MIELSIVLIFTMLLFVSSLGHISIVLIIFLILLINIYLIFINKINVKFSKIEFYILFIFILANIKNIVLFLVGDVSVFSLFYSFGEVFLLIEFFILIKNRERKKILNIFLFSYIIGFSLALYILIFNKEIVSLNDPIILMLPYAMSYSGNKKLLKISLGVIYISFAILLDSRGEMIAYLFYIFINMIPHKKRNLVFKVSFITLIVLFVYILNNHLNLYLNILLTSRPFIWMYYVQESFDSYIHILIGHGRMGDDTSTSVSYLLEQFLSRGVKEQYSPHNFYIYYMYEHGLIFTIVLIGLIFLRMNKESKFKLEIMSFLVIGFSTPLKLGGFGLLSLFFTIYLVLFLDEENYREKESINGDKN